MIRRELRRLHRRIGLIGGTIPSNFNTNGLINENHRAFCVVSLLVCMSVWFVWGGFAGSGADGAE